MHSCPRHPRAGVSHVRKDAILDVQATGASGVSRLRDYLTMTASVQFSRSVVSESLRPYESQHARPPCPSPSPGVHSDSRPSSRMSGPKWGLPSQAHSAHRTMRDNISLHFVKVTTFWGGCCYCCFSKLLKWDIKSTYSRLHKPWVYSIVKFHEWVHLYNCYPDQDRGHFHNPEASLMLLYKWIKNALRM